ncbi:unnamed protein product [Owenia fusiformis]|uniref:RBR-type E3 ubiquitin transferase n=1 Tax=Owenia fusiformis TaxID=6347 RepID=A0A8J1UPQ8_OWEFU|nr:unnamed protein product [Owenia fusiformis]
MMAVGGADVDWTDGLSESQLEQYEEIEALQSILADTGQFKLLSSPKDGPEVLFSMQLNVCVKTQDGGITVEAWVPYEHDIAHAQHAVAAIPSNTRPQFARSDSGRRWHSSFNVQHLTPLCLQVTLPQGYPNDAAPIFTLSCLWLDTLKLTVLCKQLDSLWKDLGSMPIIYTWIDWLEHNTLDFLALTDKVILTPYLDADSAWLGERDSRALPECVDLDDSLITMLRHSLNVDMQQFTTNNHECGICFVEKPGREFFRISDCHHHFCRECMTDYCNLHVGEGTVQQLHCPDNDCKFALPPVIIQAVLGNDEFQRWERLLLQKALDTMGDITWCPRCNNAVIKESEESLKLAHCTTCMYSFCTACNSAWHQGEKCKGIEEKLRKLEEESKNISEEDARQKKLIRDLYLTEKTVADTSKPCPRCKVRIQKNLGCNKIHCLQCGTSMCYSCGADISQEGYGHFTESPECSLSPVAEYETIGNNIPYQHFNVVPQLIRRVPKREKHERDKQIAEALKEDPTLRQNIRQCPSCKQRNLKENMNNHIKCWQCSTNFCGMCMKKINGKILDHFKKTAPCIQHSES